MNDRIQELAHEAGYKHPDAVGTIEDYAYFNHEKFAELIIQECVDICDAYGMPDGTSPVARIISKVIKHKFGMDE
jgi:hypothetical protein